MADDPRGNPAVHVDLGESEVDVDVAKAQAMATCYDRLLRHLGYDPVIRVFYRQRGRWTSEPVPGVPASGQRIEVELKHD